MQPNISHSVVPYLNPVLFNLFEKHSTRCQTLLCFYSKTAPAAVPDASDLSCTSSIGLYNLRTGADIKTNFSASKAACYSAPNINDFLLYKVSVRGAATLANP